MCPTLNPIPEQSITELHYHSIKHFEVGKRNLHANKQWSPDKIRVRQLGIYYLYLIENTYNTIK